MIPLLEKRRPMTINEPSVSFKSLGLTPLRTEFRDLPRGPLHYYLIL
jgi:hypothetical protein